MPLVPPRVQRSRWGLSGPLSGWVPPQEGHVRAVPQSDSSKVVASMSCQGRCREGHDGLPVPPAGRSPRGPAQQRPSGPGIFSAPRHPRPWALQDLIVGLAAPWSLSRWQWLWKVVGSCCASPPAPEEPPAPGWGVLLPMRPRSSQEVSVWGP